MSTVAKPTHNQYGTNNHAASRIPNSPSHRQQALTVDVKFIANTKGVMPQSPGVEPYEGS